MSLQRIFQTFGPDYKALHAIPTQEHKAMNSIASCRTPALGGRIDQCDECGFTRVVLNSCGNRHCPQCQSLAKAAWLQDRQQDLLLTGYFHVVFTVPEQLNSLGIRNKKEFYAILFRAASQTLLELAGDKKHLGAQIGVTAILHTWGQNLMFHPHIHCVVTGGGLSLDGNYWVSSRKDFFIPVKVLSKKFRGKFLALIKKAFHTDKLIFPGKIKDLAHEQNFLEFLKPLYKKDWVVYCKPPFAGPEKVFEYLGNYTHRVAISNSRIVSITDKQVAFKWRDYKDGNKNKLMTLDGHEFMRRFLFHILPQRFVKIRHYGLMSNRCRNTKLLLCKKLLKVKLAQEQYGKARLTVAEILLKLTGKDITLCPCCRAGKMLRGTMLYPRNCSPPQVLETA